MSHITDIIQKLKGLDLTTYPHEDIKSLIGQFGKFGLVQMTLHPGKTVFRVRPNNEDERFSTRSELSYKPEKYNTTYQRASTPNQNMFYAGLIPENFKEGELDSARVISTIEASNLLREKNQEGEQLITVSKWVVTKDIPLIAICYHKDFTDNSSHTKELYEAYQQWIQKLPDDLREKSMLITEFLAREFAKSEIRGDFDYMISAIFSEITVGKGKAGIYYPSVRAAGMGFNAAIAPQVVDSSLKLVVAGECRMYKKSDHTIVDNEMICQIDDDSKAFIMNSVAPEHHIGREKVMAELNKYA